MAKKQLKGIRGWLLLYVIMGLATALLWVGIGIGIIVNSIRLFMVGQEIQALAREAIELGLESSMPPTNFSLLAFGSIFFSIVPTLAGLVGLYGIYLIFKKNQWADEVTQIFLWVNLITFIVALIASFASLDVRIIGFMLLINVMIIAWMQYFKRSVRVNNTLVK